MPGCCIMGGRGYAAPAAAKAGTNVRQQARQHMTRRRGSVPSRTLQCRQARFCTGHQCHVKLYTASCRHPQHRQPAHSSAQRTWRWRRAQGHGATHGPKRRSARHEASGAAGGHHVGVRPRAHARAIARRQWPGHATQHARHAGWVAWGQEWQHASAWGHAHGRQHEARVPGGRHEGPEHGSRGHAGSRLAREGLLLWEGAGKLAAGWAWGWRLRSLWRGCCLEPRLQLLC
jgi:hypothetical protein